MKLTGIIMAFMVLGYSAQPLLSEMARERPVHEQGMETSCCDPGAQESCCCCGDENRESSDDSSCNSDQPCSMQCECAPGAVVLNALACYLTEINAYSDFLGELQHPRESYHYSPFSAIWHPPKA